MFFVLKRESPDWARLKSEGFQLIPFASEEHQIALMNAKFVVSSQPDEFNKWPEHRLDREMCRYRLVFLQHGVIKDDISRWLNSKPISLMLTSTQAEYESIVDPQSDYRTVSQRSRANRSAAARPAVVDPEDSQRRSS